MERLTFEGNFYEIAQCAEMRGGSFCEDGYCSQRKVWERLKEYEDTGLTPEQCAEFAKADKDGRYIIMRDAEQAGVARFRELSKADKGGRVVVLPCKVGDTVWFRLLGRIIEKKVSSIVLSYGPAIYYCSGTSVMFHQDDIGKAVFLTREEAEKALEERKDG